MTREQLLATDELDAILHALPPELVQRVRGLDGLDNLLEIVMDLGRLPEARFTGREEILSQREVTAEDIAFVISRIGQFGGDNRAGIERTLHRISALRNRAGKVVGLTLRVGRAVYGTMEIIRDVVEAGRSIMLLGRPGVGKTTLLRAAAVRRRACSSARRRRHSRLSWKSRHISASRFTRTSRRPWTRSSWGTRSRLRSARATRRASSRSRIRPRRGRRPRPWSVGAR